MGYNVSYRNGANGVSNFIKGKPSNLWDFVCDHPIISFLIADKVISGALTVVNNAITKTKRETDISYEINGEALDNWIKSTDERLAALEKDQQLNEGRLEALEKADDRFEELLNKLIEVINIDVSDVGSGSDKIVVDEADTEVKD